MVMLLGIGLWADRRFGSSYEGFVSAERSLGGWVAAISSAASSESGWLMLGLSGLGYKHGYGAYWASFGCSLGFIFTSIFVVRQLRRSSGQHDKVLTLGDYFVAHFGGGKSALRIVSSLLITFFMLVYVVAQFTAAGKQMAGMKLLSYHWGVMSGAAIIGIYVLMGGYAAVCWTDLIQGLLMLAVLIVLPIYALLQAGGFGGVSTAISQAGLDAMWVGGQGPSAQAIGFALTYFGFSLGYPGMPHAIIRYITIRDDKEATQAAWIGASYGVIVLFASASLGIFGRALTAGLTDAEQIMPHLTATLLPPVIGGVVLAAVSAAIMSTADSQLMLAASALMHDVLRETVGRGQLADKMATRGTRAVIAVMTVGAMAVAFGEAKVIDTLVLFAWGCLGAAFSPVIMLALYWPRFNWQGAVTCMVVGPTTIVLWQTLGLNTVVHGLIPGTALSLLAGVVVALTTPARMVR
jgi:sodium/proline symporter